MKRSRSRKIPITKRTNKHEPEYIGKPDGPKIFVPEFGCEVGTFTQRYADMESPVYSKADCLMYHVPIEMRGPYSPQVLANYDETVEYPTDMDNLVFCNAPRKTGNNGAKGIVGSTQTFSQDPNCRRKAVNRSGRCQNHGGKLHPMDKQKHQPRDPSTMSRWELLQYGYLTVDDLDDEELIAGMARNQNGSLKISGPSSRMIPRELYDKLVSRMFERANEQLRQASFDAVSTIVEIMNGDAFEAVDRKDAAKWILERVLGKAPQTVDLNIGVQKPYEQILSGIAPITREQSRAARGLTQGPKVIEAQGVTGATYNYVLDGETDVRTEPTNGAVDRQPAVFDGEPQRRRPRRLLRKNHTGSVEPQWDSKSGEPNTLAEHLTPSQTSTIHAIMAPPSQLLSDGTAPHTPPLSTPNVPVEDESVISGNATGTANTEPLTKEQLKERIQKGRNRRYAARAQGKTSIRDLGYQRKVTPTDYVDNKATMFQVQWVHPDDVKVPASVKATETKRRNRERRAEG